MGLTLGERGDQLVMFAYVSGESTSEETLGTRRDIYPVGIIAVLAEFPQSTRTTFDVTKAATDMYRTAMKRMQARLYDSLFESVSE
jgi:hypothetical protein